MRQCSAGIKVKEVGLGVLKKLNKSTTGNPKYLEIEVKEGITPLNNIAQAQAQHGHRGRERHLFQQWQWNQFYGQRHWKIKSPFLFMNGKKILLLPACKAFYLWCYSKWPINHMANAISSQIFNISSFPGLSWRKNKTLQSLPVRSVTILFSQKVPHPACGFFIYFPNKIQNQRSTCWGPQTI